LRSACGPIVHRHGFQPVGDRVESRVRRHAVQEARIDHHAAIDISFLGDLEGRGVGVGRHHDRDDRQAVFVGEIEVALVARRTAENSAVP
jgi:hypothetical protein